MAKIKSAFFCQNCGYQTPKWLGKCPSCSEWNTFVEEIVEKNLSQVVAFSTNTGRTAKPQPIQDIGNLSSLVFDCRIRYYAAGVFFNLKAWANTFTHGLQSTLEADQLTYFSGSVNTTLKIEASRIYKERCQSETGWYSWTVTGSGANNGITAQSYQGSKGLKKAWLKASFFYWNGKDWIKIPPSSDWYPPYHRGIKSGY